MFSIPFTALAQDRNVKIAKSEFTKPAFIDAPEIYIKVVESSFENPESLAKLN
jgi:hypothetical protein